MTPKDHVMQVRMSAAEKASFDLAADAAGISLSSWVRARLRTAALVELQLAGVKVPFVEAIKLRSNNVAR